MPFQVNFSNKPKFLAQVILVDAGEDQYHICTPVITLSANINGDITGHTVEWVQIKGTTVVLEQANTLTPYFNQVDTTDKAFRLYIDRNTPNEQYGDVNVFKTPTTFPTYSFYGVQHTFEKGLNPLPVYCNDISGFVEVGVNPPSLLEGDESGFTTTVIVSWDHPGELEDKHIEQYRVVENNIEVASIPAIPVSDAGDGGGPPSDTLEYLGGLNTYRIDTYYNIQGIHSVRQSCDVDLTTLAIPDVAIINTAIEGGFDEGSSSKFERTNYTYLNLQEETVITGGSFSGESSSSKTLFSNLVENVESFSKNASFSGAQQINITKYDPSGIGGG